MANGKNINYKQFEDINNKFLQTHDKICQEIGTIQQVCPDYTCIVRTTGGVFDCDIEDLIGKIIEGKFGVWNPNVLRGYGCLV